MDLWDILISCEMRYLFNVKFECGISCETSVFYTVVYERSYWYTLCKTNVNERTCIAY